MALIRSAVRLIIEQHVASGFRGPVLTLGVPEIYATEKEIAGWRGAVSQPERSLPPAKVTTNPVGKRLGWVTASTFFQMMGLDEIVSIDIPGCEHPPDLVHNLNDPLPEHFLNRFNLIIDPGTVEHAFDVKTCLGNIARALKVGGIVVNFVPIYSYNGGYFSINPIVLHDFYRANGFRVLRSVIIMWDRFRPFAGESRCYEYGDAWLGSRHALADHDQVRFTPHLLLFSLKESAVAEITCPIQHEDGAAAPAETRSAFGAGQIVRSVLGLADRLLPFNLAYELNHRAARMAALRRIRKHSFWA